MDEHERLEAETVARVLLAALKKWGAYKHYHAKTGSIYIKFPVEGLGSIRISNHKGKSAYKYRWNVEVHKTQFCELKNDRGIIRLFVGRYDLRILIDEFQRAASHRGLTPIAPRPNAKRRNPESPSSTRNLLSRRDVL